MNQWRIGELARATGLTVRTLHHYEAIGLLPPPSRTEGRQRRYDERDVRRLYRICALRELGLSLGEVGRLMRREGFADVLQKHRARVRKEIVRLQGLEQLLDHACQQDVSADDLLVTIEAMVRVTRHGRSAPDTETFWTELGRKLRACLVVGLAPSTPRVRLLARAALERIVAFAGGDQTTLDALAHLRKFPPQKIAAGWDAPLLQYLDRALEAEHAERTNRHERRPRSPRHRVGRAR